MYSFPCVVFLHFCSLARLHIYCSKIFPSILHSAKAHIAGLADGLLDDMLERFEVESTWMYDAIMEALNG
jgi:hypothetical protein